MSTSNESVQPLTTPSTASPTPSTSSATPPPSSSADARVTLLKTRRGVVEIATWGSGPAILSLHGVMGGYDQSMLLAQSCGPEGFRYIAVSRPGYLETPFASGKTPEEQADLCAAILDELGIRSAAVMAVSGGGPCALQFALRHPDRCWGVVMVSACSGRLPDDLPMAWYGLKVVARIPGVVGAMRRKADRDPDRAAQRSIRDPAVRARTLKDPEAGPLFLALQHSTMTKMAKRMPGTENDIKQTRKDMVLPVERLTVPLLAVHGTIDDVVPFAQAKSLVERVPGAQLLTIDRGEHVALFTHRDVVRARVCQFLIDAAARARNDAATSAA